MSTPIEAAAYAYLDPTAGASRPRCVLHTSLPAAVVDYLEAHIADLTRKAASEDAPPAEFHPHAGRALFRELETRTGSDFEMAAARAAEKLQERMDNRTKPGLFVAVRRQASAKGPRVAILKLDIVEKHAGRLAQENGQVSLEVVENVLELTGTLQKGAAIPDSRAGSEVIVGEKSGGAASQYFLRALEIRQMAPPATGARELLRAVRKAEPEQMDEIAARFEGSDAKSVDEFFEEVGPLLPEETREKVEAAIASDTHLVNQIAPKKAQLTRTIEAEGIAIRGAAGQMKEKVKLESLPGDKWRAEIVFEQRPEERYD
jgi:hypothetical protein